MQPRLFNQWTHQNDNIKKRLEGFLENTKILTGKLNNDAVSFNRVLDRLDLLGFLIYLNSYSLNLDLPSLTLYCVVLIYRVDF